MNVFIMKWNLNYNNKIKLVNKKKRILGIESCMLWCEEIRRLYVECLVYN